MFQREHTDAIAGIIIAVRGGRIRGRKCSECTGPPCFSEVGASPGESFYADANCALGRFLAFQSLRDNCEQFGGSRW